MIIFRTFKVVVSRHSVGLPAIDDLHPGPDVPAVVRHHVELGVHTIHSLPLVVGAHLVNGRVIRSGNSSHNSTF